MDAWETRYGEQRAAAIDRLEQLCQDKHHLKMPSMSNNPNNKAKKKTVDVSQLKAPTPSIASIIEDAQHHCIKTDQVTHAAPVQTTSASSEVASSRVCVKAGKISVTAKPHGVRTSFSPLGSGKMAISQSRKSLSSPEPMSIGGDSERSRSPSPAKEEEDKLPLDSDTPLDNVIIHTTSVSEQQMTTTTSDTAATSTLETTAMAAPTNCNFEATHNNQNNANDTNDNNFVANNSADSATTIIVQDNR